MQPLQDSSVSVNGDSNPEIVVEHKKTVKPKTDEAEKSNKSKKSIQFDSVTVYYFTRQQGFSSVPSQGGCSLGMATNHHYET